MSNELQPSEQKPLNYRKPYGLPKAIDSFCLHVAQGVNYSESYRLAYPKAKTQNPQRLLKRPDVQERIKVLKAREWEKDRMEKAEQQAYLGRVIRTPVGEVDENSDLAQEYTEEQTVNKDGSVTTVRKVKMVPKATALAENAKIEGMYFSDRTENKGIGFGFLLEFAKYIESGAVKQIEQPPKAIDV